MKYYTREDTIGMGITIIGAILLFGIIWFGAYNEAKSYRKFCDTPVTTWDALWLDLRIDECVK
jgi:hypothetical protein